MSFDIPYSRTRAIRYFGLTTFPCGRWAVSSDADYGIPVTTVYCGRFGYLQLFWQAVR